MKRTNNKRNYSAFVALAAAWMISSSTALVFANETATMKITPSPVPVIGRFVVTPFGATYEPAGSVAART